MDPETFCACLCTMYALYAQQVWSESVRFWRSYYGKGVVNGEFHVKYKRPPSPQSGSDPDQSWSVDGYCHPLYVYPIWKWSIKYSRSYEFLKIGTMLWDFVRFLLRFRDFFVTLTFDLDIWKSNQLLPLWYPNRPTKFHQNRSISFCVILYTNKQTNESALPSDTCENNLKLSLSHELFYSVVQDMYPRICAVSNFKRIYASFGGVMIFLKIAQYYEIQIF